MQNIKDFEAKKKAGAVSFQSLIKKNINFWVENILIKKSISATFMQDVADQDSAITTASLSCHSGEVAYTIAGYAAKKLCKKSKCIA